MFNFLFDFYDVNTPHTRKNYCNTLYKIFSIIMFLSFVFTPFLLGIILAIAEEDAIFLLLILGTPFGLLFYCLFKMILAVSFGACIDLADLNIRIKAATNIKKEAEKDSQSVTHNQTSTNYKNGPWDCPKCGYHNPSTVNECENCFSKRLY